jgi:hypothetical protein
MVALGEFAVAFLVQKGWRDQDIYERKTPTRPSILAVPTTTRYCIRHFYPRILLKTTESPAVVIGRHHASHYALYPPPPIQ